MTEGKMELSIALSDNERTRPLIDGLVKPQGMRLHTTVVHPSEMFWRQLKYADFDVSEMSVSSLLIAASRGDYTWAAIPVFTFRMFFHTRILVRADRGIKTPQDLRGKRIGMTDLTSPMKLLYEWHLMKNGVPADSYTWHQYPADVLTIAVDKGEIDAFADGDQRHTGDGRADRGRNHA